MGELSWMLILMQAWRSSFLTLHCHYSPWSLSVQFSCSFMSDSLQPHGLQHARPPCPSPTPRVYSNSCPLSWWCHPSFSSSVIPFSSLLPSFPASGSFQMSQFFTSSGQSIGVSALASVLPVNIQDWFSLGWTGWIHPKGTLKSLLSLVKLLGIEKMFFFFFFSVSILLIHVCSC